MNAFGRLASFLLFVISLGLLTSALPTTQGGNNALSARYGQADAVVAAVVDMNVRVKAHVDSIALVETVEELKIVVEPLAADIQAFAKAFAALGAVKVDAVVEADIAAKVAAMISVIVEACVDVSAKFGLAVIIGIFAKLDFALKLFVVNLGICIEGIIVLIAKIVIATCNDPLTKLSFKLCLSVLALVRL